VVTNDGNTGPTEQKHLVRGDDPLGRTEDVLSQEVPSGVDRRTFLMRSAVVGATAVMVGRQVSAQERAERSTAPAPPLSADLEVVKKQKGPVMTTVDEFYKVGPGPSSSHTIGPMRITYDFYQRCTKLPAEQLAKATALKVHLFGSLSATARDTARSARRSPAWSARSRRRSIRRFSITSATSPISPSR